MMRPIRSAVLIVRVTSRSSGRVRLAHAKIVAMEIECRIRGRSCNERYPTRRPHRRGWHVVGGGGRRRADGLARPFFSSDETAKVYAPCSHWNCCRTPPSSSPYARASTCCSMMLRMRILVNWRWRFWSRRSLCHGIISVGMPLR